MLGSLPLTLLVTLLLHWTLASPVLSEDRVPVDDVQGASLDEASDDDVADEWEGDAPLKAALALCLEQETPASDCLDELVSKRSLLRFGRADKKAVLRWGKRGSVIRWGKKAQPLRWGKRQMPTFRFG